MNTVLTEIRNKVGYITLNSEQTLNALSLTMFKKLKAVLSEWESSDDVECILLQGAGRKAFCAGGDVRKLYDVIVGQRKSDGSQLSPECLEFFVYEYSVDYMIHTYRKPIIVWGDRIVMGGGIGLMAGASHRIVTERSTLAMPEITIGLYPDVGGTWFLNKMPSAYGLYIGLTATRLNASDSIFLGLADHFLASDLKGPLVELLDSANWNGDARQTVSDIITSFSDDLSMPASPAEQHLPFIKLFENIRSTEQFREIIANYSDKDDWINKGSATFDAGSPSSAHIILKQLEIGKNLSLEDVFRSELNLSCQCCMHPDFAEGVRALLVDKDRDPSWNPPTIGEVTDEWVESYFKPLWSEDAHPLKDLGKYGADVVQGS